MSAILLPELLASVLEYLNDELERLHCRDSGWFGQQKDEKYGSWLDLIRRVTTVIRIRRWWGLRNADLANFTNVRHIDLKWCDKITNAGLIHVNNASTVSLRKCQGITDDGLLHLKNVKRVDVRGCLSVTWIGVALLRSYGVYVRHSPFR